MRILPNEIPSGTEDGFECTKINFNNDASALITRTPLRAAYLHQWSITLWRAAVLNADNYLVAEVRGNTEAVCRANAALIVNAVNAYAPPNPPTEPVVSRSPAVKRMLRG